MVDASTHVNASGRDAVSRGQLALNVDVPGAAVSFYSKLFDAAPAKVRPGYAAARTDLHAAAR
jgi:hypothetical protein